MNTGAEFSLGYALCVTAAILLAILFPASRTIIDPVEKQKYRRIQALTLIGAVLGAKLAVLAGDHGWPFEPVDYEYVLFHGRSITGGFLGGFLVAELAKPLFGYSRPPNDHFAAILPFSVAIGRLGCLLAGCCQGVEWHGPLAITDELGLSRHPAQLYELAFHLLLGIFFQRRLRRVGNQGTLFAYYMVAYGVFRFFTEFIRETPEYVLGMSAYQWLSLIMVAFGMISLSRRSQGRLLGTT